MAFVSHAQNYEDVMLWRALSHVEKGFYIDVGACDPVEYSVTKSFYDAGWCGINLEPAASAFEQLRAARWRDVNLRVAASGAAGELQFFDVVGTGLSTTKEEIAREHTSELGFEVVECRVAAQTLTEICEQHGVRDIHFLKIDVEGAERDVLLGLDLERVRPWIILVEATLPGTAIEHTDAWEELVTSQGYHSVWFDGLNRFYVADEHGELDAAFHVPPNVWDRFVTYRESSAADRVAHFENENVDLRVRAEEARARLAASESERADLASQLAASESERAERTRGEAHWHGLAHQFSLELRAIYGVAPGA